jgi:hypothetical protein
LNRTIVGRIHRKDHGIDAQLFELRQNLRACINTRGRTEKGAASDHDAKRNSAVHSPYHLVLPMPSPPPDHVSADDEAFRILSNVIE